MNIETEKKYVIEMPDLLFLSTLEGYTKSEIEQIYLNTEGVTHRIRRRTKDGFTVYTETKKRRISQMSVVETENEIDELKYNELFESNYKFIALTSNEWNVEKKDAFYPFSAELLTTPKLKCFRFFHT